MEKIKTVLQFIAWLFGFIFEISMKIVVGVTVCTAILINKICVALFNAKNRVDKLVGIWGYTTIIAVAMYSKIFGRDIAEEAFEENYNRKLKMVYGPFYPFVSFDDYAKMVNDLFNEEEA